MSQPPGQPFPGDADSTGDPGAADPRSEYGYGYGYPEQDPARPPSPAAGSGEPPYIPPPPPGPPPVPPVPDGRFPAYGGHPQQDHQQPTGYPYPGPYQQPGPYSGHPHQGGRAFPYQATGPYGSTGPATPRKRRGPVLIAAGIAALLLAGAGTYAVVGGDDGDGKDGRKTGAGERTSASPSGGATPGTGGRGGETERDPGGTGLDTDRAPGEARTLFVTRNDVDLPRGGAEVHGPWSFDGTLAKAMYKQVTGYSATDGGKKWTVPLEREICSATPRPSARGTIVVGIKDRTGTGARCRDLRSIDLGTGKVAWKAEIPEEKGFLGLSDHTLTISGDTLAAGGTGVSYGFAMKDGKRLFTGPRSGCKPFAYAGGPRLLAAVSCPTGDYKKPRHQLQQIDPDSGKARWTYDAPTGWEIDKVYSTDPVVVSLVRREPKSWTVVALKSDGTLRAPIAGGKEKFRVGCGGSFVIFGQNLEGCQGVVADPRTLYLATEPVRGRGSGGNEIIAFDLDTGRPKWRAPSGGDTAAVPVRMDGRHLIVYREPSYGSGGAVATVGPAGGTPRTLLRHPGSAARIENSFYSVDVLYEAGRVYLAARRVSAANDAEELRTPTMLAFGP
ncbi:PQQ-binding-like beta-propeller repeat protein [Streptomyces qinzhouensis]|uniref:PQQ-binding-like beta-propeller repeat protein n=1 Tax=Streptomyces qinzhouensis TaxID=2599401 RepID=A0A5B8JHA4_9ACTN|nr:PQQ-binding-like beta-propeller repeat protein [Streptomyces qinzhouensis]QDY77180.1 PQQ-binding-like beta-propeller repeat protein [Streptomyces qinzhouensis]